MPRARLVLPLRAALASAVVVCVCGCHVVDAKPKLQASSLWGAVAKVLDDEASSRMVRATALFAVVKQTMEARRKIYP